MDELRRGCRIVCSMSGFDFVFERTVYPPGGGRGIEVRRELTPDPDGKPQPATVRIPERLWMKRETAEKFAVAFAVALELATEAEALPVKLSPGRPRDENP